VAKQPYPLSPKHDQTAEMPKTSAETTSQLLLNMEEAENDSPV